MQFFEFLKVHLKENANFRYKELNKIFIIKDFQICLLWQISVITDGVVAHAVSNDCQLEECTDQWPNVMEQ